MRALCEDGQLPTSERDDLVRVFRESFGLSESAAEVLRMCSRTDMAAVPLAYRCWGCPGAGGRV